MTEPQRYDTNQVEEFANDLSDWAIDRIGPGFCIPPRLEPGCA